MIHPQNVHETLKRHQLADGFPFVLDLDKSHGSWLHDARTGTDLLDFFTCFASWPIGYNHPRMSEPAFCAELLTAARNNPANSDLYTVAMARFVEAFATRVTPAGYPYHFWISGGALAIENALKVAFDWKAQKLGRRDLHESCDDLVVLHFKDAFHGRSGYTLSLTNTDPTKTGLFPKFRWPRVHNPGLEFDLDGGICNDIVASEARACAEIERAFAEHKGKVAAIVIEPMQSEGGDHHFRPEFLERLRAYADEQEALLVFDEVQTGFFGAGTPWLWQKLGVAPDIVAFAKKSQQAGIYSSKRVDDVAENCFHRPSRINSTWGGNLTDMVRATQIIDIILREQMPENIAARGQQFIAGLRQLGRCGAPFSNVRGVGSLCAFTLADTATRDAMIGRLREQRLLALKSGSRAIRFRLPLNVTAAEVDLALGKIEAALPARAQ
ncbi:MAG: L-lysine 6-transaminase [Planctomycetes bacterium]|nr:L-lysine 6-transaminase [Planctomycetota bacterium]